MDKELVREAVIWILVDGCKHDGHDIARIHGHLLGQHAGHACA